MTPDKGPKSFGTFEKHVPLGFRHALYPVLFQQIKLIYPHLLRLLTFFSCFLHLLNCDMTLINEVCWHLSGTIVIFDKSVFQVTEKALGEIICSSDLSNLWYDGLTVSVSPQCS